jgi:DNA-binding NarL/FixJ family response regulator
MLTTACTHEAKLARKVQSKGGVPQWGAQPRTAYQDSKTSTARCPDAARMRHHLGLLLVVDNNPQPPAALYAALDAAGYGVTVAADGSTALLRAAQADPDLVLLDASMDAHAAGADAFALARRFKTEPSTAHMPIVFFSDGPAHADVVLAAFEAGAVDCVRKDIGAPELLVRLAAHVRAARHARQARNALDAYGHATIAVHINQHTPNTRPRLVWQTPLARAWLPTYFDSPPDVLPEALLQWLQLSIDGHEQRPLTVVQQQRQLVCNLQSRTDDGDWLVVLREVSDAATVEATMQAFRLTVRESEVLYWVVKGKTNRDVGDILGSSPATVKKHLERVYEKLGVETRTAAAAMAMQRVRELNPA